MMVFKCRFFCNMCGSEGDGFAEWDADAKEMTAAELPKGWESYDNDGKRQSCSVCSNPEVTY